LFWWMKKKIDKEGARKGNKTIYNSKKKYERNNVRRNNTSGYIKREESKQTDR